MKPDTANVPILLLRYASPVLYKNKFAFTMILYLYIEKVILHNIS
jgi:hypothetical protein